jgi:hypothetical protein
MTKQLIVPRPCARCAFLTVNLADDGRMHCYRCKGDRGLLDADIQTFIRACEQISGPLTEPIVLRGKNSTCAKRDRHLANLASAMPSEPMTPTTRKQKHHDKRHHRQRDNR